MSSQWEQRPIQKNRRQVLRRIEAHLYININKHGYDMNWLINRAPGTQHRFPFVALEDSLRAGDIKASSEENEES